MNWKEEMEKTQRENHPLFRKLEAKYNKIDGIRVGDWVKHKGTMSRVTYIWRDETGKPVQVQTGGSKYGSFFLDDGYISYSGSLDSGFEVQKSKVKKLPYLRDGMVWIWKGGFAGGGRGINYMMKFRVFEVQARRN